MNPAQSAARLNTVTQKNLAECQAHLLSVVSSDRFLKNEGLNNEVPFHICPFTPGISQDIIHAVKELTNALTDQGIKVLGINLYDLVVEILKEEGDWDWLLENESTLSRKEFKEELQGILDTEKDFIQAIEKKMSENNFDVMFITGVGEVFSLHSSSKYS